MNQPGNNQRCTWSLMASATNVRWKASSEAPSIEGPESVAS